MTDKEFLKQLGLKLKCQRIMTELEIKDVASKSGLHPQTIQKIERGTKDFHILSLRRLANVYSIELKEVF
jgi:transcriptional regulator with XRE-family HTH domain